MYFSGKLDLYIKQALFIDISRGNLLLDRDNTGNLKMEFEWGPCSTQRSCG